MNEPRKICVVTGTRAEYGLLSRLMRLINDAPDCTLQVVATNMHLMEEFGNTYREIEADGFVINEKVAMPKAADNDASVLQSMSTEITGMTQALQRLAPDIVVILGDRYEMLVTAIVAMMLHIPIAHLHGGEITEGAVDESIRHSITKMSSLHFTSTEEYRKRVIQLGEHPDRVFYVGSPGVENMHLVELLPKSQLEEEIGLKFSDKTLLATYHPVTLSEHSQAQLIDAFLQALNNFTDYKVLFTMPNSDAGSSDVAQAIEKYCAEQPERCRCYKSLGMRRYLSALHYTTAVVGNSSSGIIEAPSAHIPTLNIGERQQGRTRASSVIDCGNSQEEITAALTIALSAEHINNAKTAQNPYDKPGTAQSIFNVIANYPLAQLRTKPFFDIPVNIE